MKKLICSLILISGISLFAGTEENSKPEISVRTKRMARDFGKEVEKGKLREKAHIALDALFRRAVATLKKEGHEKEADIMWKEWSEQYQFQYILMVSDSRHIGEHGALSIWLKEQMEKLTFLLGKEIVYNLRLSDIRTFNETPKVVLGCYDSVDEAEYFLHLVHDEEVAIRGLGPCTAYWVTYAGCIAASGGVYCSPIAMGVEWVSKNYVFPKLNEPMWKRVCKQP